MFRVISNFFFLLLSIYLSAMFLFLNKSIFNFNDVVFFTIFDWFNIKYFFGIDAISIFFVLLCSFLLFLCIILNWYLSYKINLYLSLIILSMFCLLNVFFTTDIFILFMFFEFIVFPLFLIVGIFGSRDRKIYAAYLLFIYTLFGSIFALFIFLYFYFITGSSNFFYFIFSINLIDFKLLCFLFLFFGFSIKVPIIPVHIWLPEAHVEAPTVGSVILAGIVLKLSFYIYLRLLIFIFFDVLLYLSDFLFVIFIIGIILPSFFSIAQIDMKKIIAYSSISHMNYSLIGLFSGNIIAMLGSAFMMFGHAIVSSALFMSIGSLYDRFKSRVIFYYSGLVLLMPVFVTIFFIFILSNFGFPGTVNFVGEFVIFVGAFYVNNLVIFLTVIGMFLTMLYSLFLYNRISTGVLKLSFIYYFSDLSRREFYLLSFLCFLSIILGIFPNFMFDFIFSNFFIV